MVEYRTVSQLIKLVLFSAILIAYGSNRNDPQDELVWEDGR